MKHSLVNALKLTGTPCYVYEEQAIQANIKRFLDISYAPKSIHFATMANNNVTLLSMLKQAGLGVFVNSMKHLLLAMKSNFAASDIVYATTGISREDMHVLGDKGVHVHLDSLSQVQAFGAIHPGSDIGIRLNIGEMSPDYTQSAPQSRIGMTRDEYPALLDLAAQYRLRIVGVHVYLGTNIPSVEEMIAGSAATLDMATAFPDLEYVDLGGGFPVDDDGIATFDYAKYSLGISELFEKYSRQRGRPIKLIIEPGRSLFGDTAVFCSRVLDVKQRGERLFVSCDASISILPRPFFYGSFHPVSVLGKEDQPTSGKSVDIVGCTTYSRDYLGRGMSLPELDVGDVLVFHNAGSYCYSMMSQFLGLRWPAEVLIDREGVGRVIREPETIEVHS